jgi:hypothetical protein
VQFTSPVTGRHGQYTALIPPSTIPGEPREIIVKSPDLCGLMDQLDDLFGALSLDASPLSALPLG